MNAAYYTPATALRPYIRSFIIIESDHDTENFVLPDTSMVLAIKYKGHIAIQEEGTLNQIPTSAFSGIRRSPRLISYAKGTANLLTVFEPCGARAFFKEPLNEFFRLSQDANYLKGYADINEIAEQLSQMNNNQERITFIQQQLLSRIINPAPDKLIASAAQRISAAKGNINITRLARDLYISQDAFEKRFRQSVGTTAKQFASIVKLKTIIENYSSGTSLTNTALEGGYYDQAHFIKHFKTFTGTTPQEFFKKPVFW